MNQPYLAIVIILAALVVLYAIIPAIAAAITTLIARRNGNTEVNYKDALHNAREAMFLSSFY